MNRKLFLKRIPTYQEDPSFYAERVVGTVPNVFKRTYTSNQTEQVQGQFTGVDISVNVQVPQCDRIKVGSTTKLLTEFSIGDGSSVSIPDNSTLVTFTTSYTWFKKINVICRSSSDSVSVFSGQRYYVFSSNSYAVLMSGSVTLLTIYDAAGDTDMVGGTVDVLNTIMTFTV